MPGIENLKNAISLGLEFTRQVHTALADGKFQWRDAFGFIDELLKVPAAASHWRETVDELKDLDAAERQELHAFFAERFDIPNDRIEAFVERALALGVLLPELVEQWKSVKG